MFSQIIEWLSQSFCSKFLTISTPTISPRIKNSSSQTQLSAFFFLKFCTTRCLKIWFLLLTKNSVKKCRSEYDIKKDAVCRMRKKNKIIFDGDNRNVILHVKQSYVNVSQTLIRALLTHKILNVMSCTKGTLSLLFIFIIILLLKNLWKSCCSAKMEIFYWFYEEENFHHDLLLWRLVYLWDSFSWN